LNFFNKMIIKIPIFRDINQLFFIVFLQQEKKLK